jgi:hypothetical protein
VASVERIAEFRRQHWTGQQIASTVGVSPATVSRVLVRLGLGRRSALEPAVPVIRYQHKTPGEMIHLDIKKLGRFARVGHRITSDRTGQSNTRGIGWEFVHVCNVSAVHVIARRLPHMEKAATSIAIRH